MKKRNAIVSVLLLSALLSTLLLCGCTGDDAPDTPDSSLSDTVSPERITYNVGAALVDVVEGTEHDAKVSLCKVTFDGNDELTNEVNAVIYDTYIERYDSYKASAGVEWNYFTTDYIVYEGEDYLSVSVLSYREGTYIVAPYMQSAVVSLEDGKLLTPEELIEGLGLDMDELSEKIYKLLPVANTYHVYFDEVTGAYFDSDGDLVLICSSKSPWNVDMPQGMPILYNVTEDSCCVPASHDSFSMISWITYPDGYTYDEKLVEEYYSTPTEAPTSSPDESGILPEIEETP